MSRDSGNLLIVDDERSIRIALCTILTSFGFMVVEAARGEEALALVRSGQFDALLLDVSMPGMDGIDVCRLIRNPCRSCRLSCLQLRMARTEKWKRWMREPMITLPSHFNCGNWLLVCVLPCAGTKPAKMAVGRS